jgi:hypothetical protein
MHLKPESNIQTTLSRQSAAWSEPLALSPSDRYAQRATGYSWRPVSLGGALRPQASHTSEVFVAKSTHYHAKNKVTAFCVGGLLAFSKSSHPPSY